jgi:hypothetical protein
MAPIASNLSRLSESAMLLGFGGHGRISGFRQDDNTSVAFWPLQQLFG